MPNGTIHKDTDSTTPGAPPRAFHRRSPIQTATPIPARMHNAYARMGKGPRCHTPWGGLGMLNGTIKGAVSFRTDGWPGARAPVGRGRLEDGDDCHYRADQSDEGGGAQPGGH